jgi:hypothetical protein
LEDASLTKSFADVFESSDFVKTHDLNFGYTQSAYWIKIELPAYCNGKQQYLVSNFHTLDSIDFYLVEKGVLVDSLKTGYLTPLTTRQELTSRLSFKLPIVIVEHSFVYVRIKKKEGTLRCELRIEDQLELSNYNVYEKQIFYFFLGMCFLLSVVVFYYFSKFKQTMYLWYALFVFSIMFHQLSNTGYGSLYLWGDWIWLSHTSRFAFNIPALTGLLFFSYTLLKVEEFCSPAVNHFFHILKYVVMVQIIFPLIPLPEYPYRYWLYLFHVATVITTIAYLVYVSYKAVLRNYTPAHFFMTSEVMLFIVTLYQWLRNLAIIGADPLPEYLYLYTAIAMMTLMMFGIISYATDYNEKNK